MKCGRWLLQKLRLVLCHNVAKFLTIGILQMDLVGLLSLGTDFLRISFCLVCFLGPNTFLKNGCSGPDFVFTQTVEKKQFLNLLVRRCLKSRSMLLHEFSLYCQRLGVVATLPRTNLENSNYGTRISILNCNIPK